MGKHGLTRNDMGEIFALLSMGWITVTHIFAGMDVSGSPSLGNHTFFAIVLCTDKYLSLLRNSVNLDRLSYDELDKRRMRSLLSPYLDFSNNQSLVFCYKIDRDTVLPEIFANKKKKKKFTSPDHLFQAFDSVIYNRHMRNKIEIFLSSHKLELREVTFECDGDSDDFAKHVGLEYSLTEGEAYVISDVVAWLNNRGKEPQGTVSSDLTRQLRNYLS